MTNEQIINSFLDEVKHMVNHYKDPGQRFNGENDDYDEYIKPLFLELTTEFCAKLHIKADMSPIIEFRFPELTTDIQEKIIKEQIGFELDLFAEDGEGWIHEKVTAVMDESEEISDYIYKNHKEDIVGIINSSDYTFDASGNMV